MAGEVTDPRAKLALAAGGATAAGATLAAGKIASKKKSSAARREAIRTETAAQRQAKLKQIAAGESARWRDWDKAAKKGERQMDDIRKKSAAADRDFLKAAKKAEEQMDRLRAISNADMNKREKLIKKGHVSNQRNIIKGKTSKTLLQIAKSVGLKSVPAVGAFISAFSSTSAGKGSDRGLPSRNYKFTPKD